MSKYSQPLSQQNLALLPITSLKGVGDKVAALFTKLKISTVGDLLLHLPYRYQDRTHIASIGDVQIGDRVVVEGEIVQQEVIRRARNVLQLRIRDQSASLILRFFHYHAGMKASLHVGRRIRCFGEVSRGYFGAEMIHPEILAQDENAPVEECLSPIYPSVAGMSQKQLCGFIKQALHLLDQSPMPEYLTTGKNFINFSFTEALHYLHAPPPDADQKLLFEKRHPAQLRLAQEELLAYQLSLRMFRDQLQSLSAPVIKPSPRQHLFMQQLGFQLTGAQSRVGQEIDMDLCQPKPMLRLVQGDVGSGKTVVAAMAVLNAVDAGFQAAMMAPTELLAEQHAFNLEKWLKPLQIKVVLLTGSLGVKAKREVLAGIQKGEANVIVGTHALIQSFVEYQCLGLVIIDEQHRFGVEQRLSLRNKGNQMLPHQLIMTATPIPRTLAMCAYADLDVSMIDELPPNRTPVQTVVMNEQKRQELTTRIQEQVAKGVQVYWVCTLVEESEVLEMNAAEEVVQELQGLMPDVKVGLIHGRMKAKEKNEIMQAFKENAINVLVATTVIEVGVDVPNASLMVIDNAERLGLSQLHQLRGRVGRGTQKSTCVLLYKPPISQMARERLQVMKASNDGFLIAEKDLQLRGAGELLGQKQTGALSFKIADLHCHEDLLTISNELLKKYEHLPEEHLRSLIQRWIGSNLQYIDV